MEKWKAIPGYDNYEVSDLGNVRNIKTGRILKPRKVSKGYLHVLLRANGKSKKFYIHKLVAIVFLGHIPDKMKITVDHLNGIKTDNRLENLELVSDRENKNRGWAKRNTSSQFPGVNWSNHHKKWRARVGINGKLKYLGISPQN